MSQNRGYSDRELADRIARHLSREGTEFKRETANGNEFILRRRDDGETELLWFACERTVGESEVTQLEQAATDVGAGRACVVTTAGGELRASLPDGVDHRDAHSLHPGLQTEAGSSRNGTGTAREPAGDDGTGRWDGLTAEATATPTGSCWGGVTAGPTRRADRSKLPWGGETGPVTGR